MKYIFRNATERVNHRKILISNGALDIQRLLVKLPRVLKAKHFVAVFMKVVTKLALYGKQTGDHLLIMSIGVVLDQMIKRGDKLPGKQENMCPTYRATCVMDQTLFCS